MAIIRCIKCEKLFRTGSESLKQATCPDCGATVEIPMESATSFEGSATGLEPPSQVVTSGDIPDERVADAPPPTEYSVLEAQARPARRLRGIMPGDLVIEEVFDRTWLIYRRQWA